MQKPTYIYKYCSATRGIQVLSECALYLCPPDRLNDLAEFTISRFGLGSYDPGRAKFVEYVRWRATGATHEDAKAMVDRTPPEEWRSNYEYFEARLRDLNAKLRVHSGVTCFSARFMDQRMWGTYGNGHAGICIQFTNADGLSLVHRHVLPVAYNDTVNPEILIHLLKADGAVDVEILARELYLTKTTDWRDEEEWRILMLADNEQRSTDRHFSFPARNVRRIFLGPRISEVHRAKIKDIALHREADWSVLDVVPVPNEGRFEYRGLERVLAYSDIEFWDEHRHCRGRPARE